VMLIRRNLSYLMLGIVTGVAASYVAPAFGPRPAASETRVEQAEARAEVEQAIEHFRQAMIERRPDWILADSAEELTFGHSNGIVQSREEFADVVRSGEEIFKRIDITDRHLTVSGNVAIERHHFSADIVYKGDLMTFELEVIEVWQNTDGWHLLARQAIKV